jgi:polar amino acid transport system permease protein
MTGDSPAFLIYAFVLAVYFVICAALAALTRRLEERLANRTARGSMVRLTQQAAESI